MGQHSLILGEDDSMLEYIRGGGWGGYVLSASLVYMFPFSLCSVPDLYGQYHGDPLPFNFQAGVTNGEAIRRPKGGREEMKLWHYS